MVRLVTSPAHRTSRGGGGGALHQRITTALLLLSSFFLGCFLSFYVYAGFACTTSPLSVSGQGAEQLVEQRVQQRIQELEKEYKEKERALLGKLALAGQPSQDIEGDKDGECPSKEPLFPPEHFKKFLVDMATVSKEDFVQHLDPGVPLDPSQEGGDTVLLLYSNHRAKPDKMNKSNQHLSMPEAVENCAQLNLILADHGGSRHQCFAIMPQYESYHIQRWMRVDENGKYGPEHDLRMVSRGQTDNGMDRFRPPPNFKTRQHWTWLYENYFPNLDASLQELQPILDEVATKDKTVIVMVCNFGQSELLMNFVCSARQRGFADRLNNILVFTTDKETTDIAKALGLKTYFDERNFADAPKEEARVYGDKRFIAMMMAKVTCVQLVSMLGYNLLFQDVDIVWFKDPLPYFDKPEIKDYDVFFQDDGGHSLRYAPYSANSGFYFVRHNDRTRHFLSQLLMAGDLIISTKSHQQALIAFLQEHVSLHGLRAKVLSRDTEEFPGGFHYHRKNRQFMYDFFAGKVHPYIFHMSWTTNKNNKLLFFRQMGEWFVQDKCIQHTVEDVLGALPADGDDTKLFQECCSADPLISCHYRDKPSKIPCKDSPTIDQNGKDFW